MLNVLSYQSNFREFPFSNCLPCNTFYGIENHRMSSMFMNYTLNQRILGNNQINGLRSIVSSNSHECLDVVRQILDPILGLGM